MKHFARYLIIIIPLLVGGAALIALAAHTGDPEPDVLTGVVEAKEVGVLPKIPGRVASILVAEGDHVARGQTVATLTSEEVEAKVSQAEAAVAAARAVLLKANNGARPEEIEAVRRQVAQAQSALTLAEKSYHRVQNVYDEGVVSEQERDQARFKYDAAADAARAAEAQLSIVRQGARSEDIAAARANVDRAEAALSEALVYRKESQLASPLNGEVVERVVSEGEVVAPGYPVMTVVDLSDAHVILQVREDQLSGFRVGGEMEGNIPALGETQYPFRISRIAAMADFATWRATNERGDFDVRTFEVELKPRQAVEGLRPGMTARFTLPSIKAPETE